MQKNYCVVLLFTRILSTIQYICNVPYYLNMVPYNVHCLVQLFKLIFCLIQEWSCICKRSIQQEMFVIIFVLLYSRNVKDTIFGLPNIQIKLSKQVENDILSTLQYQFYKSCFQSNKMHSTNCDLLCQIWFGVLVQVMQFYLLIIQILTFYIYSEYLFNIYHIIWNILFVRIFFYQLVVFRYLLFLSQYAKVLCLSF
eukprot:TRINITY_DN1922_c0_g1_i1.p2 TRINITY_DN1922_c0_g1~~TRINITY_DN1922_c0_g1_i1.p2  ORF type:complete len:197 (+),score=-18.32 TRINITY_DN1922_c0_g1_i1:1029-1619(+)